MLRLLVYLVSFLFPIASTARLPVWRNAKLTLPASSHLAPVSLTFSDSLHGILVIANDSIIVDKTSPEFGRARDTMYYFATADGGKTWTIFYDTLLVPGRGGEATFTRHNPNVLLPGDGISYISVQSPLYPSNSTTGNTAIVRSPDGGDSWQSITGATGKRLASYPLVHAFSQNNILVLDDSLILWNSYDGGRTFRTRMGDMTYRQTVSPSFGQNNRGQALDISFDNSDALHWTVAVNRQSDTDVTGSPMGLWTLLSSNFGTTWKAFHTEIPGERPDLRIEGTLQYIKGTPSVYYFTCRDREGGPDFVNTWRRGEYWDYGTPLYGIDWMYSSDYGATWVSQNAYSTTRRAFEAVADSEVWITRRASGDTLHHEPAYIIARTTDNGTTWEEDGTTLTIETEQLDGRMLTFTDPKHGWLAAVGRQSPDGYQGNDIYVFRYNANEQPLSTELDGGPNSILENFLRIYPNPSASEVRLEVHSPFLAERVEFYDMLGRQVFPKYRLESNAAVVDVSRLPSASYIAVVVYSFAGSSAQVALPLMVQH